MPIVQIDDKKAKALKSDFDKSLFTRKYGLDYNQLFEIADPNSGMQLEDLTPKLKTNAKKTLYNKFFGPAFLGYETVRKRNTFLILARNEKMNFPISPRTIKTLSPDLQDVAKVCLLNKLRVEGIRVGDSIYELSKKSLQINGHLCKVFSREVPTYFHGDPYISVSMRRPILHKCDFVIIRWACLSEKKKLFIIPSEEIANKTISGSGRLTLNIALAGRMTCGRKPILNWSDYENNFDMLRRGR